MHKTAEHKLDLSAEGREVTVIFCPHCAKNFINFLQEFVDTFPTEPVSLDFETTALLPWEGEIRITSITAGNTTGVIDHRFAGPFVEYFRLLTQAVDVFYVFNVKFEGLWMRYENSKLDHAVTFNLRDIELMRKSVMGGGPLSLKLMAKWDLGLDLSKDMQDSDWSADRLTHEQYYYAALDAMVTRDLALMWTEKMDRHHWRGFEILNSAWPATVECEQTGFYLDSDYHSRLVTMWAKRRDTAERAIRKIVPEDYLPNIRSKKQISDLLRAVLDEETLETWPKTEKTGQLKTDRSILNNYSYRLPYPMSRFLAALMVFNRADKYHGTYGDKLLNCQNLSNGIFCGFNMARAITGRFSSSGAMNAQNYPNNPKVRRSFIARPNAKLIIADYKSIELRILAEMSGDERLLHDVVYGDVHAASAIDLFRYNHNTFSEALKNHEAWAVADRRRAKGFSFQLTYGAGSAALAVVLRCSDDEATEYIKRWAERYPKAYNFRHRMWEHMNHDGFLPCQSGRTIYIPRQNRSLPVASNYPIQGTGADVMYAAMRRVYDLFEEYGLAARMVAVVHDEILAECYEEQASEAVEQAVVEGMILGWQDIFPDTITDNLVSSAIGDSWADKD